MLEGFCAVLAGPDQDRREPGPQRPADITLDVVPDHGGGCGIAARPAEHLVEESGRRLPDHVGLATGGVLERRDEGTDVERETVRFQPVAVFLQGHQFRAVEQALKGAVEHVVSELLTEVAHDHHVRSLVILLELGEILLDVVTEEQAGAAPPVLQAMAYGQGRGRDQLGIVERDAEPMQLAQRLGARARGRVGDEAKGEAQRAQPLHRLAGAGNERLLHVEHPVEVEKHDAHGLEPVGARSLHWSKRYVFGPDD